MPESLQVAGSTAMAEAEPDLSTFENKSGLAEDMKFLASMPELCDVTFLVGDTREPVCAVKAVLAARSRVFHKMLYQAPSPQRKKEPAPRENKLRLFLKRSSEPLLNLQNASQQVSNSITSYFIFVYLIYSHTLLYKQYSNINHINFSSDVICLPIHQPHHRTLLYVTTSFLCIMFRVKLYFFYIVLNNVQKQFHHCCFLKNSRHYTYE